MVVNGNIAIILEGGGRMLSTLIPLFDENKSVKAYSLFTLKKNYLLNPTSVGIAAFDGAGTIAGLEVLNSIGLETLSDDKEVFVEVNHISIYSDIAEQCKVPNERVVLLLSTRIKPTDDIVKRVSELKSQGFKLAMRKLAVSDFEVYTPILKMLDYVLLNHARIDISKAQIYFSKLFPNIELCAVNVNTQEDFDKLTGTGGYKYYEGAFFRVPLISADKQIAPLKVNYIELLNVINDVDFDLGDAADVISRDAALVISLLKIANRLSRNSEITSVKHACAMIGQKELKQWINTAVTEALCADRPNEIIRMVMIRAKFAQELAPLFEFAAEADELFLMGLFSMLDIMLDKTMEEALDMVLVSKDIRESLLTETGKYSIVMDFLRSYESADWTEISRVMLLRNISDKQVEDKYIESLKWYHDMFGLTE